MGSALLSFLLIAWKRHVNRVFQSRGLSLTIPSKSGISGDWGNRVCSCVEIVFFIARVVVASVVIIAIVSIFRCKSLAEATSLLAANACSVLRRADRDRFSCSLEFFSTVQRSVAMGNILD
jgi:hypothetical protein